MKDSSWEKIDKFYLTLAVVLLAMSVLIIFSFRGIFGLFVTAYELDPNTLPKSTKVDKEKLNQAYEMVFNKEVVTLENPQNLQPAVVQPQEEQE